MMQNVDWGYYDKFDAVNERYLLPRGEGDTLATQATAAVNKLVYKWYNDGDVYDTTHALEGWANDLSSYANWLVKYLEPRLTDSLYRIAYIKTEAEYEHILSDLADRVLDEKVLEELSKQGREGSIYECDGPFEYDEYRGYEDEEEYEEEEEEEDEE